MSILRFAALMGAVAVLGVAVPAVAQDFRIPPAAEWVDVPALAPSVTSPQSRAEMNAEIVAAIEASNGDEAAARAAILRIAARYEAEVPQSARVRPGPKS